MSLNINELNLGENIILGEYDEDEYENRLQEYRNSLKTAQKKYKKTHPETIRKIQKNYYDKIKENEEFKQKSRDYAKEYYDLNKDKINERRRQKREQKQEENKDKYIFLII